ncbi:hypothetical protein BDV96DRAFT_590540 [Lophiotrema nucula]|uniref:C2 domain-containing protein n=1 Tax=Lophiotrema nucula TaxID=690887 RepID=A0A6A5YKV0_9PLEO|nr:hypothetical protein BDV96DRAFT_590540 [Lophiotrema nucula]
MATKLARVGAMGGAHTAGIFSDMTVDGPEIGTLVAIVDRARNLPNRRTMGKQDPYCAARLGKEAKKTDTDKRGGQTPRWDQELRFTVHDSPDYHNLKVSVFNDDKKTELIGETWVSLENVLTPGGGQSDTWHPLNCKGKYAGDIRIELTYYDTRPKAEKAPAERKQSAQLEGRTPAVGGPRESMPVKRRPLPSDPTGASPSPSGTQDHRGTSGPQSGPRGYPTPPRQQRPSEYTPTHQQRGRYAETQAHRRPLPDASPLNGASSSDHHNLQHQRSQQFHEPGFDMSYAAPKPYEVQPIDPLPQNPRDLGNRAMSQNDFRSSQGHSHRHIDLAHSYSAPEVPTQIGYENDRYQQDPYLQQSEGYADNQSLQQGSFHDPSYHVEPLRTSRNAHRNGDHVSPHDPYHDSHGYHDSQLQYDQFSSQGRPSSAMQPTVEDEDDVPPPPPVHRSSTSAVSQHPPQAPPSYHGDAPAPLNVGRYREDPHSGYSSPPQAYGSNDHQNPQSAERRYTHPRASPQPTSRPVSRDTMVPSPLRQEASALPSSLLAGYDASRQENRLSTRIDHRDSVAYSTPPAYDTPPRQRHLSEPEYRASPQYETPPRPQQLVQHHSIPSADSSTYYPHSAPQEPRHTSPVHEPAPIVKPRAISPGNTYSPAENRASRAPVRSMPTRKSVSPRPPPSTTDTGERRLSSVPFDPDSFDVFNPTASKSSQSGAKGDDAGNSKAVVNEKGQIVTFSGRVIDASDHLPLDSWAPEPERKGPQKERPVRERAALSGARDIEAARQRERERRERDRIRNAVNASVSVDNSPSNALVSSRSYYGNDSPSNAGAMVLSDTTTPPGSGGRNRLQKRNQRPVSSFIPSNHSTPSHIPAPNTQVLRERENVGGYGESPGYGSATSRHSVAAPPIPAKIPLESNNGVHGEDMTALSLELQSIDIGPGSGGRARGTARRRYGGY